MNKQLAKKLASVFRIRESDINLALTQQDVSNWDSLTQMDLVISLEQEYDIVLDIDDIVKMTSVSHIVDVLRSKGVIFED
jgi:acyl carrier protein